MFISHLLWLGEGWRERFPPRLHASLSRKRRRRDDEFSKIRERQGKAISELSSY